MTFSQKKAILSCAGLGAGGKISTRQTWSLPSGSRQSDGGEQVLNKYVHM